MYECAYRQEPASRAARLQLQLHLRVQQLHGRRLCMLHLAPQRCTPVPCFDLFDCDSAKSPIITGLKANDAFSQNLCLRSICMLRAICPATPPHLVLSVKKMTTDIGVAGKFNFRSVRKLADPQVRSSGSVITRCSAGYPELKSMAPSVKLSGTVIKGFGRGSKELGIPTANLDADVLGAALEGVAPGVYFGWASVGSSPQVYKMVMSIGW